MRRAPNSSACGLSAERTIDLRIVDPLVERAVRTLLADASWDVGPAGGKAIVLTDVLEDLPESEAVAVLRATPASCATSLRHFMSGRIAGAVCRDDIDGLIPVLEAVAMGLSALPSRVISIAAGCPPVTDRQVVVLEALMEGLANRQIARRVRLSEGTVKRELAHLATALHATSRYGIVTAAYELGYGVPPMAIR